MATTIDRTILSKYLDLPIPGGKILSTYVWIDDTEDGKEYLRAKDRTLDKSTSKVADVPIWDFGAYTHPEDRGRDSDVFLYPRTIYKDPFRRGEHILVMCETYKHNQEPPAKISKRNGHRHNGCINQEPNVKQEYKLLDKDLKLLGSPQNTSGLSTGRSYCGLGTNNVVGRDLADVHYRCCLYAGIPISGTSAKSALGQWEYEIRSSLGVAGADDHCISRFILQRLAEEFDIVVSFNVYPVGYLNGSIAISNISTKKIRETNGIVDISQPIINM